MRKLLLSLFILTFQLTLSAVTKQKFDFIVGKDGSWADAKKAAESSSKSRFYIFFPNGTYDFGKLTGDANQMTKLTKSNISLIGQSADGVLLFNKAIEESIGTTATLSITGSNMYLQDLTLQNKGEVPANAFAGRFVAFQDQGDRNILVNVRMLSTQDTYYSTKAARRTFLTRCEIHGTVDFICGGGDIVFDRCLLWLENRKNNVITAPAGNGEFGYVFLNCTIDGESINNNGYRLGRPWNNKASSVFINTKMNILPTPEAWGDPMNVVPTKFCEYNSRDAYNNPVDLSKRRSYYSFTDKNNQFHSTTINPVLSANEAKKYTIGNILRGNDNWNPESLASLITPPTLYAENSTLSWEDSNDALCYFIFADNVYLDNTTDSRYFIANPNPYTQYTIRAANQMGGLGEPSNPVSLSATPFDTNEHLFHFFNGETSVRANTSNQNTWTCTDADYTDFSWSITSRDDKDILRGNTILYRGTEYTTFKSSNGATNTVKLPAGVSVSKVTFIGYTNDSEVSSVLSEIGGVSTNIPLDAKVSSSSTLATPSIIEYTFPEPLCEEFTFTFSSKQACFIFLLQTVQSNCTTDNPNGDTTKLSVPLHTPSVPTAIYNISGVKATSLRRNTIYIFDNKPFIFH